MAFPILFALAAVQMASSLKQADEMRGAADLQNALNEINSKYLDYDAFQAEIFGHTQSAAYEKKISEVVNAQRVAYAANGVDIGYGTAAEVQKESKLTGYLNILDIHNAARAKSQGLKMQAHNLRSGSATQRDQAYVNANATEVAGAINAGATGYRGWAQSDSGGDPSWTGKSNKTSSRIR